MGIEKIDANFAKQKVVSNGEAVYSIPSPNFDLYGVTYNEREQAFVRMDMDVAAKVSEGVRSLARHTSGGRLCFATDSATFKITVTYPKLLVMHHMAITGSSGFSLFKKTERGEEYVAILMPYFMDEKGFSAAAKLQGGEMQEYVLYFPLYQDISSLQITLDENARVQRGKGYRDIAPILYYGSSITQGGCASRPDNAYQALICQRNQIDYINLGFSGSAKGEKEMVAYLGGLNCSLFVCDYDHNAPTAAHLLATHYPLYQQFRAAQPNTPILFISRPDVARDKEGEERLKIVRSTYLKAQRQGDNHVYFLSGKSFYGKKNCAEFAVDGCHPTDYGFRVMADKIYKKMCEIDEKFKGGENAK